MKQSSLTYYRLEVGGFAEINRAITLHTYIALSTGQFLHTLVAIFTVHNNTHSVGQDICVIRGYKEIFPLVAWQSSQHTCVCQHSGRPGSAHPVA